MRSWRVLCVSVGAAGSLGLASGCPGRYPASSDADLLAGSSCDETTPAGAGTGEQPWCDIEAMRSVPEYAWSFEGTAVPDADGVMAVTVRLDSRSCTFQLSLNFAYSDEPDVPTGGEIDGATVRLTGSAFWEACDARVIEDEISGPCADGTTFVLRRATGYY